MVEAPGTINGSANVNTLVFANSSGLLTSTLQINAVDLVLEGNVAISGFSYINAAELILDDNVAISGFSYSNITYQVEEVGTSTVTVNDGSELYINNPAATSDNISPNVSPFDVGVFSGNQSTFNLTGLGSAILVQDGDAVIGDAGNGDMTISSGAELETSNSGDVVIGISGGGQGTLTVTGQSSTLDSSGGIVVGSYGNGALSILAGAEAVSNYLIVAGEGSGSILVSGSGSRLAGGGAIVGDGGMGSLTIADAGSVQFSSLTVSAFGGSGTVLVEGAGSNLVVTGELLIGSYGSASLNIGAGSTVSAGSFAIASNRGYYVLGSGSLNVTGTGATLAVSGNAVFGDNEAYSEVAPAGVTIASGGLVSVGGTAELEKGNIVLGGGTLDVSQTLTIDAGQTITDYGTVETSSLINSGTVAAYGGTLSFIGGITGTGNFEIYGGATLSLDSSVGSGQNTIFESATSSSSLVLGDPESFDGTIYDFIKGDTIDLSHVVARGLYYGGNTLTVYEGGGARIALVFSGDYVQSNFGLTSDGHNGTLITHA